MNDLELLRLAAKAAGYDWRGLSAEGDPLLQHPTTGTRFYIPTHWNPLKDDGDAMQLVVQIRGEIGIWGGSSTRGACTTFDHDDFSLVEPHGDDAAAATRRAIVRAAAEIGKGKAAP